MFEKNNRKKKKIQKDLSVKTDRKEEEKVLFVNERLEKKRGRFVHEERWREETEDLVMRNDRRRRRRFAQEER